MQGLSAYAIATTNGFTGTEIEWLASLQGADGADGINGLSAYEISQNNGVTGTEIEWLDSLRGADGADGADGAIASSVNIKDSNGANILSDVLGNLNVNIANTSVPVSGTFFQTTQPVSGSVNIGTGGTTAGISIVGATVGLNVYNIYPNRLIYRMAGSSNAVQGSQFLGPEANTAYNGSNFTIGLNQLKDFNIYIIDGSSPKSVDVDYIDANGNRVLSTISITNVDQVRLSSAVNINNLSWTPTSENGNNTGRVIARNVVYRNQISTFMTGAGVITVPNGYVGIVSNLYYNSGGNDDLYMFVRDKYNNLKTARNMIAITNSGITGRYNNIGNINEPLIAGDSVYFLSGQSGAGQRYLHAIVTLEAL